MTRQPPVASYPSSPAQAELCEAYRGANSEVLSELVLDESSPGWNDRVSDVMVVLCASRSGSSLIFNALSSTGEVAAPGGEHEPWLTLTENKFPFTESDVLDGEINEKSLLLSLLRNDLLVRDKQGTGNSVVTPLRNRLIIRRQQDTRDFADFMARLSYARHILPVEWSAVLDGVAEMPLKPMPTTTFEFNDGRHGLPLENPPLIEQPLAHIATDDELQRLPLLFKSPSDAYRPGFYETLFPNARISYIHLTRGFVQTTNGLMDGWQKDSTDFISNPVGIVEPLEIEDYSITPMTRAYWCFDLFENWRDQTRKPLLEVAARQWYEAHHSILSNFPIESRLTFEEFYTDPEAFYAKLSSVTGIDTTCYDWKKPIMSTEPPDHKRWLKRATTFRNVKDLLPGDLMRGIVELQDSLGYGMDEETWH